MVVVLVTRLYKNPGFRKGYTPIVHPKNSELKYIEYGVLFLPEEGDEYYGETLGCEVVLTIFSGKFKIGIDCPSQKTFFEEEASRTDVFSEKPTAVYVPKRATYKVTCLSPMLEVGVSKAPADIDYPPAIVRPDEVVEKAVGTWNWRRGFRLVVVENVKSCKLIVGETVNPPGNWSSIPPHKHDREGVNEIPLEEVYFFKLKPRFWPAEDLYGTR